MATNSDNRPVLVPMRILEGATLDEDLSSFLSPLEVVILGYHVVPEQTPPGQMRQQFEEQAENALESIVAEIHGAGGTAEWRLIFTHDAEQSIDRVADEIEASAILRINPVPPVRSIVGVVDDAVDQEQLARFLTTVRGARDIELTLFAPARTTEPAASLATVEASLRSRGVPASAITTNTGTARLALDELVDVAVDHDITVMAKHQPGIRSFLFGDLEERVAAESLGPVVVLRRLG